MTRLMVSLAAGSDNPTIGEWSSDHGIGGVVVVVIGGIILVGILSLLAKIGKKK